MFESWNILSHISIFSIIGNKNCSSETRIKITHFSWCFNSFFLFHIFWVRSFSFVLSCSVFLIRIFRGRYFSFLYLMFVYSNSFLLVHTYYLFCFSFVFNIRPFSFVLSSQMSFIHYTFVLSDLFLLIHITLSFATRSFSLSRLFSTQYLEFFLARLIFFVSYL